MVTFVEKYLKKYRIPRQQYYYAVITISLWVLIAYTLGYYLKSNITSVPKILHRIPPELSQDDIQVSLHTECENMYKKNGWDIKIWYDSDIASFIEKNYPSFVVKVKKLVKFLILYHYGGVFIDMDVECIRPINGVVDGLVRGSTFWMTHDTSENFMMSTKGSKFALFAYELGEPSLKRISKAYAMTYGTNAIRPYVVYDKRECQRGNCKTPTYDWEIPKEQFRNIDNHVVDKIGFIPKESVYLDNIDGCKLLHCHNHPTAREYIFIYHSLDNWRKT